MSIINKIEGEKYGINQNQYYLTEFDLVNATGLPVSYDLFNTTTLSQVQTTPAPTLPPSVVGTPIAVGTNPIDIAYNTTNNTMYVINQSSNDFNVIDCNTNSVIFTSTATIGVPQEVLYNSINNTIYIYLNNNQIRVVDCTTNLDITTILLPFFGTNGLALNTTNNTIYVVSQLISSVIGILDCNTNTIISTIPLATSSLRIEYSTTNNAMYIPDTLTNGVYVIDCFSNTVVGLPIPVGVSPIYIQYCSFNNCMYVSNNGSNDISVIDCNTNTVIATIPIGASPFDLSYNSQLNIIYVACLFTNTIVEINAITNSVASTISMAGSPIASAYNNLSNTLYTANNSNNTSGFVSPAVTTTTYIGGSFNYNDFVRDLLYNPVNVKQFMLYSNNIANINQVIYATTKDANGQAFYYPKFPALSLGVNQFQASVSKIDFGNKGFTLDANTSLSNFTIQGQSSIKLILVQQQLEKSKLLTKTDNFDLFRNKVRPINGNKFDNLVPLSKVSIKDFFYQVKNDM